MKAKKVTQVKTPPVSNNAMRKIKVEKLVVSCGGTGDNLAKSKKLLELITKRKAQIIQSTKRIPDFNVRPGLEVGTRITMRRGEADKMLKLLLGAIQNKLSKKQIADNHFSFGIEEYIEIPGIEYQRDIGIRGLNVTVAFARAGLRVKRKKVESGKIPKRQSISASEIINYLEENFKTKFE